jgi:predicted DCC family thiol-disulfide oxidoreductase YuxK
MLETIKHTKPILFYDGSCPLCKKEINHAVSIDKDKKVDWIDISTDTLLLKQFEISHSDAMKQLHVIDQNGDLFIGVDAFMTIWQFLPYYQHLKQAVILLHIKRPMIWAYDIFAKQRYKNYLQRQACSTSCKL